MNESSNQSSNESIIAKMMYKKYTVQYLINKNINTMKVSRNLSWNLMIGCCIRYTIVVVPGIPLTTVLYQLVPGTVLSLSQRQKIG